MAEDYTLLRERIREDKKRVYETFLGKELQKLGLEDKLPYFADVIQTVDIDTLTDIYQGKDLSDYVQDISQDVAVLIDESGFDYAAASMMQAYFTHMGYLRLLGAKYLEPKLLRGMDYFQNAEKLADILPSLEEEEDAREYLKKNAADAQKRFAYFLASSGIVNTVFRDVTERFLREYNVDSARLQEPSIFESSLGRGDALRNGRN